jgi:aromatic ring-opening dioxygenase catalytic subunit (LigB family)
MEVVGAFACSHAGLIISHADKADPGQKGRIYDGFAEVARRIEELAPDAVVIIATDHGRVYSLASYPQFVIGVSPTAKGIGDSGLPEWDVPLNQPLAQDILEGAIENGVDLAFSEQMKIDHSFITPLMLITPAMQTPIIPIMQNCNRPPLPTLRRAHEVGYAIGEAIRTGRDGRVVVVGTGGLSHWVGDEERRAFIAQPAGTRYGHEQEHPLVLPDVGDINTEFDHQLLDSMAAGRFMDFVGEWPAERMYDEAGNGSEEIRNWIFASGAVGDAPARTIAYEPIPEWHTGIGIVEFSVS